MAAAADEDEEWLLELLACNRKPLHAPSSTSHVSSTKLPASEAASCEALQKSWACQLDDHVMSLERTCECLLRIAEDPCVECRLPKRGAIAGQVLKHVHSTLQRHLKREEPAMYKVGFTHDAVWRFRNKLYGYAMAPEQWQGMVVVYISHEPCGPAFLEAAMIQRCLGFLACMYAWLHIYNLMH